MEEGQPLNEQNQEQVRRHTRDGIYDLSDEQSQSYNMQIFGVGNPSLSNPSTFNNSAATQNGMVNRNAPMGGMFANRMGGRMNNPNMPMGSNDPYNPNQNIMSGRIMDARQRLQMQNQGNQMVCQECVEYCGSICNVAFFCTNMCLKNNVVTIPTGMAGIQLKYGQFDKILPSGTYYINNCIHKIKQVDIKTQIQDIFNVHLLTREQISVTINAYVAFRIIDPFQAEYGISGLRTCISDMGSSILKTVVARNSLPDILRKQSEVARIMRNELEKFLRPAGVIINNAELTSFSVSGDMQNRLAMAAVAERDIQSRKLIAESELECAKMYNKAAELMKQNKGTLELTYFETLKEIAEHKTHTVIMPSKMIFLGDKGSMKGAQGGDEEVRENEV